MRGVNVKSEVKTLRKVLLHRPGRELLNLTPDTLSELLFDDIPFLRVAQREHDTFADILRGNGVEVCYLEELVSDVLDLQPALRSEFIEQFIREAGIRNGYYQKAIHDYLLENFTSSKALVLKTMEGINLNELKIRKEHSLISLVSDDSTMVLAPIPNLYFTRDPFAVIGNGVSINRMYSVTRKRETIYAEYIFKYHPDFSAVPQYYNRYNSFNLEGGDILALNEEVIAVGISQRTEPDAIEQLSKTIFASDSPIKTVLAFNIPSARAFMHLDTVFTQIDYDKFTIFSGIFRTLDVFEITPGVRGNIHIKRLEGSLEKILTAYLEHDIELILCAGGCRIAAEREQWNDGSNLLCVSPGKVIVYERNEITNAILRHRGVSLLEIPSSELSRGRGGPRCMSMPLWRED